MLEMPETMNRFATLLRRFLAARNLGFTFIGTTKSRKPARARLGGRYISLSYPEGTACMSDIINLWLDDEYGVRKLQDTPGTIVDIGGNIGLFSLWVWHHFPQAHLYTFEPNPLLWDHLTANLSPTNAQIHKAGVSAKSCRARMNHAADSRLASTVSDNSGDVELISLSQILKDVGGKIDLLKMDCEGAEWDIFQDKDAFTSISVVRMEYHLDESHSLETLEQLSASLGYRIEHLSPNQGFGIAWLVRK